MNSSNALQEFSNAAAAAVEKASKAIVAVNARRHALSAGIHWRPGIIVTANHTVRRDEEVSILLPDGHTVDGSVVGRDTSTDIALLKIGEPLAGLASPELGDLSRLKVGNIALAVGRIEAGPRASLGAIGVVGGTWKTWQGGQIDQLIRLGFNLHPTLSGGALVDCEGNCLGMNTSGLSRTLGVAIPPPTINRVADLLLQKGYIPRGYLGVGLVPIAIPASIQSKLGLAESRGLMVQHVEPGGPAESAGILIGDVLLRLDSTPLMDVGQLLSRLTAETVGAATEATIIRAGSLIKIKVEVQERPR